MKILNKTTNQVISDNAKTADTFISRLVGLLNRASLNPGEALLITHCHSIHMFFMRFPIDVIFINDENNVVGLIKGIKPFQMSPFFLKASCAIETPIGVIDQSKTAIGHWLKLDS